MKIQPKKNPLIPMQFVLCKSVWNDVFAMKTSVAGIMKQQINSKQLQAPQMGLIKTIPHKHE